MKLIDRFKQHLLYLIMLTLMHDAYGQCPIANGDETSFGINQWIGYVYDGADDYSPTNYQGFIIEPENFDESFCGSNCNFSTDGCDVNTTTFSIRFKMMKNYSCGLYRITIGGDDGYRLSLDGGNSFILERYQNQAYTVRSVDVSLNGSTEFILEYYENTGANRISFDISVISSIADTGGIIANSQENCGGASLDPSPFSSTSPAVFCSGILSYQWESSTDGINFTAISGATAETYDAPTVTNSTIYRRRAENGIGNIEYSNQVSVTVDTPAGDQTSYGNESWIGYVYDGADNFTSSYRGFITETETFDEDFCGANCDIAINGCSTNSETFSVRFKMLKNFTCGRYLFEIGGDDGVRLSIDGGATFLINEYRNQAFSTYSASAVVSGPTELILEYYENAGGNRVAFTYNLEETDLGTGGFIGQSQDNCSASSVDPLAFTSIQPANFCSGGTISYQWQNSTDGINFLDIAGATSETYDSPLIFNSTIFRRSASNGVDPIVFSNEVSVAVSSPPGDQISYGIDSWIGYVYDETAGYDPNNYIGFITANSVFDENFGSSNGTLDVNGCDSNTETFSIRYKMRMTFECGDYIFTLGSDDGARLSIDGGSSYIIDRFSDQGYSTSTSSIQNITDGDIDLVIEYYENGGANRVSFNFTQVLSCPLPVTWLSFTGFTTREGNLLEWQTAEEDNNSHFEVEKSYDGIKFESLGFVSGNGTVNHISSYRFLDTSRVYPIAYYRIKQIDFNGAFDYSSIIRIEDARKMELNIYPSNVEQILNINHYARSTVRIINNSGDIIYRSILKPEDRSINLSALKPGVYIIQVYSKGEVKVKKFIKE